MEEEATSEVVEVGEEVEAVEVEAEQQAGLDLTDDSMELDLQIMTSQKALVPRQTLLPKTK